MHSHTIRRNRCARRTLEIVLACATLTVRGAEYFVSPVGNDTSNGLSWAAALASPQAALLVATNAGDIVTVTNGVYVLSRGGASGATVVLAMTINKAIHVRSVEGAGATILDGQGADNNRIALMRISDAGAVVEGFTFKGGWTWQTIAGVEITAGTLRDSMIRNCFNKFDVSSGATLSLSGSALVERCVLTENETVRRSPVALLDGVSVVLRNCLFHRNRIGSHGVPGLLYSGGSAAVVEVRRGTMQHVTIANNSGISGGVTGLYQSGGTVANSIIYHNRHPSLPISDMFTDLNVLIAGGTLTDSILSPLVSGSGNVNADPMFVDPLNGDYRLAPASPAIDAGQVLSVADDLNGDARPRDGNGDSISAPDLGAYEAPTAGSGALRVSFSTATPVAVGPASSSFTVAVDGADIGITGYAWDFGNGQTAHSPGPHSVQYSEPGYYWTRVSITNVASETAVWSNVVYRAPSVVYAAATGGSATFPFDTPAKATPDIQRAIDAAAVTATATSGVHIADGTYSRVQHAPLQMYKGIEVRSLNGQEAVKLTTSAKDTRIVEINHPAACLSGVTVTNAIIDYSANYSKGGGIWLENGTVRDSRIVGNRNAHAGGIQIVKGLVDRCIIAGNTAHSTWNTHAAGGGVNMLGGTLRNSLVTGNQVLDGHTETSGGGGITMHSTGGPRVENCTVVDNTIPDGHIGGGIMRRHAGAVVVNALVWHNREAVGTANDINNSGTINYANVTCSAAPELTHDPEGTGNQSALAAPGFVDRGAGNYRLAEGSPCVNAGTSLIWMTPDATDLAGKPRVTRLPDLGAYEFQPPPGTLFLLR